MKYVNLINIRNPYPTIFNYKRYSPNTIRLGGRYSQNFKDFEIPNLEIIEVVENTDFKFIIELKNGDDDDDFIGLYTSPFYYADLINSKNENNPYPLQNAFNEIFTVKYNINELTKNYNTLKDLELELNVKVDRNIFYKFDTPNEYRELIKYIDWVVSKPILSEIGTKESGVIPVNLLSEYTYAQYLPDTGSFDYVDNTLNQIRLSKLENELSNNNFTIDEIEDYLENPDSAKLRIPGGAVAKFVGPAGVSILTKVAGTALKATIAKLVPAALLGPVGLIGASVVAAFSLVVKLIGANKKKKQQDEQIEEHINKLKSELVKLKERRTSLTDEIEKIKK
jgi:DNA-binding transcriptional MerR regulator